MPSPRFLTDENFNAKIVSGVLRREPSLDFQSAKAAGILGLPDEQVLAAAAQSGRLLVSHDVHTMPKHFNSFIVDATSAGVLIISRSLPIREAIEQILIIWAVSDQLEWQNRLSFVPF